MKKGFTLIELLAVIVILAVILTIAVPAVKKTVDSAKKKSAENDAIMIKNIAEKYYTSNLDKDEEITGVDLSSDTLSYSGEKPTKGYLYFTEDGIAYGKMYINGYCVEVKSDGTNTSTKTNESDCNVDIPQVTTYENGTVVYYNPETNSKCTSAEAVSVSGTKTGCMKWYVFNDDGKSKTVNLLLDHNTTAAVPWITEEDYIESGGTKEEFEREIISKGPITALKQLKSDTSTWNKGINPRLIEANEIVTITEYPIWDNNFYYFHTNSQTQYKGAAGTNKYAWLFDNTRECTTYGCNVADSSTYGYWTNTVNPNDPISAWNVYQRGTLRDSYVESFVYSGVRPVVSVNRSIITG